MTFDAWWELVTTIGMPVALAAIGGLGVWVRLVDNRRRELARDLYTKIETERELRRAQVADLVDELHEAKLDAARRFATSDDVKAAVADVVGEIRRLGDRIDRFASDLAAASAAASKRSTGGQQ